MMSIELLGGTGILSEGECWERLATQSLGRLALVIDGRLEIFTVNYGLDGDGIIFRSNAGRKMSGAWNRDVTFEVDSIDTDAITGWSVVIHGPARDISRFDVPVRQKAARSWTGPKDFLVRIAPRSLSGRRLALKR